MHYNKNKIEVHTHFRIKIKLKKDKFVKQEKIKKELFQIYQVNIT
jgi:hypothetical protein